MANVIAVFGATGIQGGSVARALLQDSSFKVRGITRNMDSEKAKALAQQGVEMVQASSDDVASLEKALVGCYGVFALTNYWEFLDKDRELQQGKNMVDASLKAGVKHFIFSSTQSVKKLIGKDCPHMDGKAEVDEYMFASDLPSTSVLYSTYLENILTLLPPQKIGDGEYSLNFPMEGKPLNMVNASAAGPAIVSIFKNPDKYIGQCIGLSGDKRTIQDYCDIINKYVAPAKFTASQMTTEQYSKLGFPEAEDLAVMFEFFQTDHPLYSVEMTKELDPQTMDFEDFIIANKEKLLALMK